MNHLKLATAAIYIFTSTTVFAQTRGSTVPTTGTVTNTTVPVNNSNNGVATYGDTTYSSSGGTDGNIVNSTSGAAPSTPAASATPSANVQSSGTTADSATAGGYAPIVTNDTSGIQSAGKSSSGNNTIGMILGIGATAYAGYNAVTCCSASPACAVCGWWVAGTLAAAAVTGYMMTAKNKSDGTVAAVTDPSATSSAGTGTSTGTNANTSAVDYSQDPAWQNAQKSIDQLKATGWNIDPATGTATNTKTGQTISASDLSSPAAMSAAGYSASDIKAFQGITDQMNAAGKKLAATRGVDASGDLFDGVTGGGKAGSSAGNVSFASAALRTANRQASGAGINRDPAQVAGMSKSFNGEQIGVAQDSLFNMIDRRYQLHDKNGGFISP